MTEPPPERTVVIESDGAIAPLYPSNNLYPSDTLYPGGIGAPTKRTATILLEDRSIVIEHEDRQVMI